MSPESRPGTQFQRVRRWGLLAPPVGLVLLWRSREVSGVKKFWGTAWLLFYGFAYFLILAAGLYQLGVLDIEWRGGYLPALTRSKTLPNYDALEAHRTSQRGQARIDSEQPARDAAAYWTDFRGPNRDGHYDQQPILTNWPSNGPRLLWRQPIGGGYSSFVIADHRAFTLEQRRKDEAVVAYDLETGKELWSHRYYGLFEESMGGDGPRATPTYHRGRLFSLGALGQLQCLSAATGRLLWSTNILMNNSARLPDYGLSASPLVVDGKVVVVPGGPSGQSVAAYDILTAEPVWKSLDDPQAYSSPIVTTLAGQRQLLLVSAHRAVGLRVEDGTLLWEYPWLVPAGNRNIAQPVLLSTNRFFLSAGYGKGCEAVEVNREGTNFVARSVWKNIHLKNKFSSSVLWEGHIYGLDEDRLACLDAATGARLWKGRNYGYGQLLLASGHLIILCGNGDLALVKPSTSEPLELARCPALRGKTWNHPALADGLLLVRNSAEMACFDLR